MMLLILGFAGQIGWPEVIVLLVLAVMFLIPLAIGAVILIVVLAKRRDKDRSRPVDQASPPDAHG